MNCFTLTSEVRKKEVVIGVPLSLEAELFLDTAGVGEARRLVRL